MEQIQLYPTWSRFNYTLQWPTWKRFHYTLHGTDSIIPYMEQIQLYVPYIKRLNFSMYTLYFQQIQQYLTYSAVSSTAPYIYRFIFILFPT